MQPPASPVGTSRARRLKVLVSAYACEPGAGSEPGVGWAWIIQQSRFNNVWVITHSENRELIEIALKASPLPDVTWNYLDLPKGFRGGIKSSTMIHFHYYFWQIAAYLKARQLQCQIQFDLIHHITFGCYWRPSFLALLPPPFIWGPVGGGESTPGLLFRTYSLRGKLYEICRAAARWLGERDPFVKLTAGRSVLALARTRETAERLGRINCRNVKIASEIGLTDLEFEYLKSLPLRQKKTFTIVSIGRLLQWKGFHLALQAFAQFCGSHRESEYWIIGDGPEKGRLQKLASNHGLEKSVRFLGRLTRREVLRRLGDCDVLVHPSLHDSGGTVCVEAMAAGRPIICLECGGAKQLVPTEAGIKVVPQDTTQTVRELRNAIEKLAQDFDLRLKMGEAGRRHISTYHRWHSKGELLQKLVLDLQLQ